MRAAATSFANVSSVAIKFEIIPSPIRIPDKRRDGNTIILYSFLDKYMPTRLNKWLSQQGFCSRREADRLITDGKVTINKKIAVLGDTVGNDAEVRVHGKLVRRTDTKVYIALFKPVGYITTMDESKKDNVLSLIDVAQRVYPIGRLDVESSGLLLLTNDGELTDRLTHPRYRHEKEYIVTVRDDITRSDLARLHKGVMLEEGRTLPADVRMRSGGNKFAITLREGRNRQIRRMCEAIGHKVVALRRVRVATVSLGRMRQGEWRKLPPKEVSELRKAAGLK